jgi:spore photoproduct lyase
LNKSVITVHANLEEIFSQIEAQSMKTGQKFRIGTGEHSDSLALDPWTGINRHLIPFIAKLPNAVLELKTKSSFVEQLLDLPHGGKTVISWSINPANFVNREEHKTAKLEARLKAARLASDAGYKVAFHFDPLIYQPNWKQEYQRLAEQLFDSVSPDRISWISFGTLRYLPALKTIAEERFPQSRVFLGEFIQGEDGKYRYMKRLRRELLQGVREIVHKRAPTVPTYYCMEKTSIWEDSLVPASPERMEEHIIQKVSA